MADLASLGDDSAVTFMVSAGLVYEIIAAACSSPQTTEINAHSRAETLMKWVKIGLLQAGFFVLVAATVMRGGWPAVLGGVLAGVIMYASYEYARRCGLASDMPGTEGDGYGA